VDFPNTSGSAVPPRGLDSSNDPLRTTRRGFPQRRGKKRGRELLRNSSSSELGREGKGVVLYHGTTSLAKAAWRSGWAVVSSGAADRVWFPEDHGRDHGGSQS